MAASWLCPTEMDRRRAVDANARVRTIRRVGSGAVGVALLIAAPWFGWWTLALFSLSVLNFAVVEMRIGKSRRPERVSATAILITMLLLATGVALSGGPSSPALPWLVLPAGMTAARFRPQVVSAALGLTALVIAAVTLGLHTSKTVNDPVPVFTTLALLIAVVSIVWALQAAEMYQRGEATIDPLTGLANRRQLSDDLADVLAVATFAQPALLVTFDLDGFKAYNDTFGHPGGDLLLTRISRAFKDAVGRSGRAYRLGGDEFCALIWDARGEGMIDLCLEALSEVGEGFTITSSYGSVLLPNETSDGDHALQLADQRLYAYKDSSRPSAAKQTRDFALELLAMHEPELHVHSSKVAGLTEAVARRLRMGAQEVAETMRAAELHDIGKVAIPEDVLHNPKPLNDEEWEIMRRHPSIGAHVLSAAPALAKVAEIVRASHERFDGAGYPLGLAGEQIPLGARIVFVCDSFDAMTSDRPYGQAKSEEEALAELARGSGTQFDPMVVEAFMAEHRAAHDSLARTA
jgi:diguanylate cyclase (GGDEF)-like protein